MGAEIATHTAEPGRTRPAADGVGPGMDRSSGAARAGTTGRLRTAAGPSSATGAHRAGRTPARSRSGMAGALNVAGGTVAVFVLALMLVTTIEVVVDRPLSGGDPGHTTLGDVLRPER